jgi:fluoride exporter
MSNLFLVFLGGGAGSVARYTLSLLMGRAVFPWATVAANLLSTALLAWLISRSQLRGPGKEFWHLLLTVGFCGGFSTMSTFGLENWQLLRGGHWVYFACNICISVGGGLLLFVWLARSA